MIDKINVFEGTRKSAGASIVRRSWVCVTENHGVGGSIPPLGAAESNWVCSYQFGPKEATVEVKSKFELRNNMLFEIDLQRNDFDFSASYKVLQNTREAIVAAVANLDVDPYPTTAAVGALVIVIHKLTGAFQLTAAGLGQTAVQYTGQCTR